MKKNFTYSTENFFFQTKSLVKKIFSCKKARPVQKRASFPKQKRSREREKITLYFSPQHRTPVAEPAELVEASFNIIFRKA